MKKLTLTTFLFLFSFKLFAGPIDYYREKKNETIISNYEQIREKQKIKQIPKNITVISDLQYDTNEENKLDIYFNNDNKMNKPVVIMVHGGDWLIGDKSSDNIVTNKINLFVTKNNYIFVSINYRMQKDNIHPQEVQDIAKSISWIYRNINKYGGNSDQLIIMGHSAGSHLVSLVSTDQKYLNKFNTPISSIKGVISLDGGGFDLPYLLRSEEIKLDMGINLKNKFILNKIRNTYDLAWKNYNLEQLTDASPINHLNNQIPPFLIIESLNNIPHKLVGNRFEKGLIDFGVHVVRHDFDLKHEEINEFVGIKEYNITQSVDEFIHQLIK